VLVEVAVVAVVFVVEIVIWDVVVADVDKVLLVDPLLPSYPLAIFFTWLMMATIWTPKYWTLVPPYKSQVL
jgi:hypothetical protein